MFLMKLVSEQPNLVKKLYSTLRHKQNKNRVSMKWNGHPLHLLENPGYATCLCMYCLLLLCETFSISERQAQNM